MDRIRGEGEQIKASVVRHQQKQLEMFEESSITLQDLRRSIRDCSKEANATFSTDSPSTHEEFRTNVERMEKRLESILNNQPIEVCLQWQKVHFSLPKQQDLNLSDISVGLLRPEDCSTLSQSNVYRASKRKDSHETHGVADSMVDSFEDLSEDKDKQNTLKEEVIVQTRSPTKKKPPPRPPVPISFPKRTQSLHISPSYGIGARQKTSAENIPKIQPRTSLRQQRSSLNTNSETLQTREQRNPPGRPSRSKRLQMKLKMALDTAEEIGRDALDIPETTAREQSPSEAFTSSGQHIVIQDSDSEDDTYPTSASKRLSHHAECFSTWRTAFDVWGFTKVAVGPNGEIAISGKHEEIYTLRVYNLDGMVMWKKKVDEGDEHKINGLCFFHLDGQLCLAVCHASGNYIEILTAESGSLLTTVKDASIEPAHINLGPEDHLLVSDRLTFPTLLRVLKVNHREKSVQRGTNPSKIATGFDDVFGICYIPPEGDTGSGLVIVTSWWEKRIRALDFATGEKIWELSGNCCGHMEIQPHGVCTDGNGKIYIADGTNQRILVLNTAGTFQRIIKPDIGNAYQVGWVAVENRLVLWHDKDGQAVIDTY